jgi:hypothetical protein
MAQEMPLYLTASYMERQFGAGIPGAPSVFEALTNPPDTGVASEDAAVTRAHDLGVNVADSPARLRQNAHRDEIRDALDTASILRVASE